MLAFFALAPPSIFVSLLFKKQPYWQHLLALGALFFQKGHSELIASEILTNKKLMALCRKQAVGAA